VLVNNAAEQHTTESISEISAEQLERTFRTNIFAMFYMTKAALPHLGEGRPS
jgi:NAD(P)-dependent dehydrogenase (short-subunit alcohol dehydrogenase family)